MQSTSACMCLPTWHTEYACRRCLPRLYTVHVSPFVYLQRPTLVWSRPPTASQFRTSTSPRNMDLNSPRKSFLQFFWYSIESEDRRCIVLIPQSYLSPWKKLLCKNDFMGEEEVDYKCNSAFSYFKSDYEIILVC